MIKMVRIATQGSTLLHIATGPKLLKPKLESFHPIELLELLEKQIRKPVSME